MMQPRFGQLLSRLAPLSDHDVDEILEEQKSSRQLFGDTAISLGMVQPEHVWRAWADQIQISHAQIDLDHIGIDSQAIALLPVELLEAHQMIPIRQVDHRLVIATEYELDPHVKEILAATVHREIVTCFARPGQVKKALKRYCTGNSDADLSKAASATVAA